MKFTSSSSVSVAFIAAAATGGIGGAYASGLERRIVGGSTLDSSLDYSFVINVLATSDGKTAQACTGALISANVVIVPASCVTNSVSSKALQPSQVVVGQGDPSAMLALVASGSSVDLSKASGYVYPSSVTSHPGYDSIAFTDNIAALVLSQPLASKATGAKLIVKPSADAGAAYMAVGWGVESVTNTTDYAQAPTQLPLTVGSNATCTGIWAPYASLTNALCLQPQDSAKANVCTGDGLLVKTGSNGQTVAVAGLLNIVAADGQVPAYQCAGAAGIVDFFTTFANYVSWLTQVTPLTSSSDFVSTDSFDYQSSATSGDDDDASSDSDAVESSDSAEENELTSVESTKSGAAGLFSSASLVSAAAFVSLLF
ncbi:hypothetical protein LPJ59_004810 [Coemansia sp. RSA 2399]|nr:hypothetical protein LPJ59_004810 [Coemansia sp. RSA 2399]KAJ1898524.1 hypothetical protein LPJ81_004325 [Coemansia sp. IMI 209127]